MTTPAKPQLISLGRQLGEYAKYQSSNRLNTQALQGVIADLSADMPDIQAPLRDLVTRQSFQSLLPHARSGSGYIQRDALIQDISRIYNPDTLLHLEAVLNGFLGTSGGVAESILHTTVPDKISQSNTNIKTRAKSSTSSRANHFHTSYPNSSNNQFTASPNKSFVAPAIVGLLILLFGGLFLSKANNESVKENNPNSRDNPRTEFNSSRDAVPTEDERLNELADEIFWRRYPSLRGKKLTQSNGNLASEWKQIRQCEAIVDYRFYRIYPNMRGRLIQPNQKDMVSTWQRLRSQVLGCS